MDRLAKIFRAGPRHVIPVMCPGCWVFVAPLVTGRHVQLRSLAHLRPVAGLEPRQRAEIFNSSSYIPFVWSLGSAAGTVLILAVICYPVAFGMTRVFGKYATFITLLFTLPLFVSENVRIYGWILFFIKNGVLLGSLK